MHTHTQPHRHNRFTYASHKRAGHLTWFSLPPSVWAHSNFALPHFIKAPIHLHPIIAPFDRIIPLIFNSLMSPSIFCFSLSRLLLATSSVPIIPHPPHAPFRARRLLFGVKLKIDYFPLPVENACDFMPFRMCGLFFILSRIRLSTNKSVRALPNKNWETTKVCYRRATFFFLSCTCSPWFCWAWHKSLFFCWFSNFRTVAKIFFLLLSTLPSMTFPGGGSSLLLLSLAYGSLIESIYVYFRNSNSIKKVCVCARGNGMK